MTSKPGHHPPQDCLVEYAAGTGSEAAALAMAAHVSFCASCAGEVSALEAIGAALVDSAPSEAPGPGAFDKVLAALEGPAPAGAATVIDPNTERLLAPLGVPRVVWSYLAAGAAAAGWRLLVPGVARVDLRVGTEGTTARIVRLRPGLEIPLHDHGGDEYTVIFTGALADDEGRFARGDISVRATGARHIQRVERGEPCVALVINEGPLLPLTLKGKLLDRLSRR
jgi:putative transcriptional regulator